MNYGFLFAPLLLLTSFASAQVAEKPEDISPILIGEAVPEMSLLSIEGKEVSTQSIWNGTQTIMIIYRGGWCPYCNLHLAEVGQIEQELIDLGYRIIAISPDAPEQLRKSIDKNHLNYSLYADPGCTFIKAMGLAFQTPERSHKRLDEYSNGKNNEHLLPVPALFIVNKEGQITFEYINPTYRTRIQKELLLAVATTLAEKS